MPKDERYTAVNMTKDAKADLERLQVVLAAQVGRRLSFSETVTVACRLLTTPDEMPPDLHVAR